MSTTRLTFGVLLNTVNTAANTVTTGLHVVDSTAGMALAAVENAAKAQAQRHAADRETYIDVYGMQKAREIELLAADINDWIGSDEDRAKSYTSTLARIQNAMRTA